MKSKPILQQTDDYTNNLVAWEQTRAAIKGKDAVVDIVNQLPPPMYSDYSGIRAKDPRQQEAINKKLAANNLRLRAYWARGRYYNATGRTHKALQGMIWSKPPEVELIPQIEYMEENADGGGKQLDDVARELTSELLTVGRMAVLVDMPRNEGRPTVKDIENGMAARLISYRAEQIFYTRTENNILAEVRLHEVTQEKVDEFNYQDKKQVRRLILIDGVYTNELYNDKCELIDTVTPRANGRTLPRIPFFIGGAEENTVKIDTPPLYDLAQCNLGHFVLDCDNRDNLHYHGQGMTNVYTDLSPQEFLQRNPAGLDVGAKGANMLGSADKVEVLQLGSTGAIAAEMERDQMRMIALGAQVVQDVNTNVTLGAKEMEFGASVSQLKQLAYNASELMERALKMAAYFMGATNVDSIKYELNTDYVIDSLTPEMLNHYLTAVQGGVIPSEIYYESLRAANATKLDDEEIKTLSMNNEAIQGESEEVARLRAENEALKAQLGGDE